MSKAKLKMTEDGVTALPVCRVVVGDEERPGGPELARLMLAGWEAKKRMDAAKADLDGLNVQIAEVLDEGYAVLSGVCRATVSRRQRVSVDDPERLGVVLGARFDDLVRTVERYEPEPKLVEMAADGDEPLGPSIRACLNVRDSQSVTWRAEK